MQPSLFDFLPEPEKEFKIVEPVPKTFRDKESFVLAVVELARKKPRTFKYRSVDAAGLVEKIFSVESPSTKVKRV